MRCYSRRMVAMVLADGLVILALVFGLVSLCGCVASREANSGSVRVSVEGMRGATVTGPLVSVAVQMYSSDTATEQTLSKEIPVTVQDAIKGGGLLP